MLARYIGASPNGIVESSCCGVRCLEVKCPHSCRNSNIQASLIMTRIFTGTPIQKLWSRRIMNHEYYCQMQTQLLASKLEKCHFFMDYERLLLN